jgi:hypothetical protein
MLIALYVVTIINVLVSSGFAIAGLVRSALVAPGPQVESSRIFALYAAARTLPLALAVIIAVAMGNLTAVLWLGGLAGVIQLADGYVGWTQKDAGKTFGPITIAVLQFAANAWVVFG